MRQQQVAKSVKESREEILIKKMQELKIGQEDLKDINDVDYKVEERLIMLPGNFYKYDAPSEKNILVKENTFFVIDRIIKSGTDNFGGHYIMNVVNQQQSVSYTRCEITSDRLLQLVDKDCTLLWVGDIRPSGLITAWAFYFTQGAQVL